MKKLITIAVLASFVILLTVLQANASLVPMSWGFPQMAQTNTLTAFQKDTSQATDNEAAAVAFPTSTDSLAGSVLGTSFPTISQTSVQGQLLNSIGFQQQTSSSTFSYPWLSIGGSPVPSMGFL